MVAQPGYGIFGENRSTSKHEGEQGREGVGVGVDTQLLSRPLP
jgi:hypothetical protein